MNGNGAEEMTVSEVEPQDDEILDVLIVGGGPAGTAAAFRAHELGLRALVIDFDDLLKRIRDYPKDKLILPDFGGGDQMRFPAGDDCINSLHFGPIDKDDICATWKEYYHSFSVPYRLGIELTGLTREDDLWLAQAWDHQEREAASFRARHVVLALGRGVPRRFDIPGDTDGIAYRLDDPERYVEGPVCVIGGGTSAAEAVIAISDAKAEAGDACPVYWSYRGTKMPRISKALADKFFGSYVGNGNIRYHPLSEPVAVLTGPDRQDYVSIRVDRKDLPDRPGETVHLEFTKPRCIACIGEDIPEAFLSELGIRMVTSGPRDKKMMAVTPLLETEQPNVYLIGDLLSQAYLETEDFDAPADSFRQVKHRGNIKSALRDGVFVAEVIKQRLEGRETVEVVIRDAAPDTEEREPEVAAALGLSGEGEEEAEVTQEKTERAHLVRVTPAGVDAEEYGLPSAGSITIGRADADLSFPQDTLLAERHATLSSRQGTYYLHDDGSRTGTYLKLRPGSPMTLQDGDLLRLGRQILLVSHGPDRSEVRHYDSSGQLVGRHEVGSDVQVFGRSGGKSDPEVILDNEDLTLSRFHMSLVRGDGGLLAEDFSSRNGTYLKIGGERKLEHLDVFRAGGQQFEIRLEEELPEKRDSAPVTSVQRAATVEPEPEPTE